MTMGQFIFGSLFVYSIIYLHKKGRLKGLFSDFVVGISIGLGLAIILYFVLLR